MSARAIFLRASVVCALVVSAATPAHLHAQANSCAAEIGRQTQLKALKGETVDTAQVRRDLIACLEKTGGKKAVTAAAPAASSPPSAPSTPGAPAPQAAPVSQSLTDAEVFAMASRPAPTAVRQFSMSHAVAQLQATPQGVAQLDAAHAAGITITASAPVHDSLRLDISRPQLAVTTSLLGKRYSMNLTIGEASVRAAGAGVEIGLHRGVQDQGQNSMLIIDAPAGYYLIAFELAPNWRSTGLELKPKSTANGPPTTCTGQMVKDVGPHGTSMCVTLFHSYGQASWLRLDPQPGFMASLVSVHMSRVMN